MHLGVASALPAGRPKAGSAFVRIVCALPRQVRLPYQPASGADPEEVDAQLASAWHLKALAAAAWG